MSEFELGHPVQFRAMLLEPADYEVFCSQNEKLNGGRQMQIYFARNGTKFAEYPEEAIPALLQSGVIFPSDNYWTMGMKDWGTVETKWPITPPLLPTSSAAVPSSHGQKYSEILASLTSQEWVVVTEGASGAQMKLPRAMRFSTKLVFAVGIIGLLAFGLGIILIILGLIDYYALTKEESYFLSRETPGMPILKHQGFSFFTKVLIGFFFLVMLIGLLSSGLLRHH
jgi:hypothetical protein